MKCKNCEKPTIEHPHMDCKQFTPSEDKNVMLDRVAREQLAKKEKGCSKCKGIGVYHSPSCSNNSLEKSNKVVTPQDRDSDETLGDDKTSESNHCSQEKTHLDVPVSEDKEPVRQRINNASSGSDFKLSYKIKSVPYQDVLGIEDVKEFIRRLKESFIEDWEFSKKAEAEPYIHFRRIIERIHKLAGKELI